MNLFGTPVGVAATMGESQREGQSVVLGTELAHGHGSLPHLALAHGAEFFVELVAVVGLRVGVDRYLCLVAALHAGVELLHDGLDGVVERTHPVEGAALSSG